MFHGSRFTGRCSPTAPDTSLAFHNLHRCEARIQHSAGVHSTASTNKQQSLVSHPFVTARPWLGVGRAFGRTLTLYLLFPLLQEHGGHQLEEGEGRVGGVCWSVPLATLLEVLLSCSAGPYKVRFVTTCYNTCVSVQAYAAAAVTCCCYRCRLLLLPSNFGYLHCCLLLLLSAEFSYCYRYLLPLRLLAAAIATACCCCLQLILPTATCVCCYCCCLLLLPLLPLFSTADYCYCYSHCCCYNRMCCRFCMLIFAAAAFRCCYSAGAADNTTVATLLPMPIPHRVYPSVPYSIKLF